MCGCVCVYFCRIHRYRGRSTKTRLVCIAFYSSFRISNRLEPEVSRRFPDLLLLLLFFCFTEFVVHMSNVRLFLPFSSFGNLILCPSFWLILRSNHTRNPIRVHPLHFHFSFHFSFHFISFHFLIS